MKFTELHEWVEMDGKVATIGITDYAQKELGDIVYVELPKVGHQVQEGDEVIILESTKAAVDIYSPLSGEIREVNVTLKESPEKVNRSPQKEGWLFKLNLSDLSELDHFMNEKEYLAFIGRDSLSS